MFNIIGYYHNKHSFILHSNNIPAHPRFLPSSSSLQPATPLVLFPLKSFPNASPSPNQASVLPPVNYTHYLNNYMSNYMFHHPKYRSRYQPLLLAFFLPHPLPSPSRLPELHLQYLFQTTRKTYFLPLQPSRARGLFFHTGRTPVSRERYTSSPDHTLSARYWFEITAK